MATRQKAWPENDQAWPTHGNAASDRDEVAMTAAQIERALYDFTALIEQGKLSRDLALLFAFHTLGNVQKILRILEANGAPTRPG